MLLAARQTIHGLYAFVRFVLFGARRPPTPRPAVLYDQDTEPLDARDVRLWIAQILEPDSDERIIREAQR